MRSALRTIAFGVAAAVLPSIASAQTQVQMNAEADDAFVAADAAMTVQWRASYAAMKARDARDRSRGGGFGYAAAALASQRAWLSFRDRQCVLEGGRYAGGSMQPMVVAQCRARLTNQRAEQLRALRSPA